MDTMLIRAKALGVFFCYWAAWTLITGLVWWGCSKLILEPSPFSVQSYLLMAVFSGYIFGGMTWMVMTAPTPEAMTARIPEF